MATTSEQRIVDLQRRLLGGYQLLQTLVGIRLRSVNDPASIRHLAWLSDMAAAMDMISRRHLAHGSIDFAAYLEDVADFWTKATAGRSIRINVRGQHGLSADSQILPLAIITHALISNAVRHAFPDVRGGSIAVAFSKAVDGVSLVVRDSGIGESEVIYGEGLTVVSGLVDHLAGTMSVETAPNRGFAVRVRLPLEATANH